MSVVYLCVFDVFLRGRVVQSEGERVGRGRTEYCSTANGPKHSNSALTGPPRGVSEHDVAQVARDLCVCVCARVWGRENSQRRL